MTWRRRPTWRETRWTGLSSARGGAGGSARQRAAADSNGESNGARGGGRGGAGGGGGSRIEERRSGGQAGSAAGAMASAVGGGDALRWQHQPGCADASKCHCRQQALRKIELAQKEKMMRLQNQAAGAAFDQPRAVPLGALPDARASAGGHVTRRYSTSGCRPTTASAPRNVLLMCC